MDDICITSFAGVLDEKAIFVARDERLGRGFANTFQKFVLDWSAISDVDVSFQLHRTLAHDDNSRLSQTSASVGTASVIYVAHVINRENHLALYGDVRAWQNMTAGHGIVAEIHSNLEEACAWLRQRKAET